MCDRGLCRELLTPPPQKPWHGRCALSPAMPSDPPTLVALPPRVGEEIFPHRYRRALDFFHAHAICLKHKWHWRLTPMQVGEFRACPASRGFLVCTNGILAFTETSNGESCFLGHLENFIPDFVPESKINGTSANRKKPTVNKIIVDLLTE